jgi:GTP-binding protein HflX
VSESSPSGETAVIVHLNLPGISLPEDLDEFRILVISTGITPLAEVIGSRTTPDIKYFVGSGKAEEIRQHVLLHHPDVVLFNHALTPAQERNLEKFLQCRVVDRAGLILDVFAKRAHSLEGKLQVELAQLSHLATRLVRGWTHLERQKGGIGLRGPGETQLETDRRLLRARITTISARLRKIQSDRRLRREARRKADLPIISLVGYTNAGKSSLFNQLTQAQTYVADQLFATLDPTYRSLLIPHFGPAVLIDTVGFIRHLPHTLIEAFKATLEETRSADLLLHIVDASHEERSAHSAQVIKVLNEIGAADVPRLEVFNKIDLLGQAPRIDYDDTGMPTRVYLSARTGAGCEALRTAIAKRVMQHEFSGQVCLWQNVGAIRAALYALQAIVQEHSDPDGHLTLELRLPRASLYKLFFGT